MPQTDNTTAAAGPQEERKTNKERLKEITDSIETGIKEVFASEKYKNYLATMSRFHKYSVNNTMLIFMQKPDATLVAGFNKWRDQFGRNVMKGERGIRIIAPTPFKKKIEIEKRDPDTHAVLLDPDGKPITETKTTTVPMFKPVTVFDVSQTQGKELPHLAETLHGSVRNFDLLRDAICAAAPVPVEFKPLAPNTDGFFSRGKQKIEIRDDMSEVQTICALVHETAHSVLHNQKTGEKEKRSNTEEIEAESVAYAVCKYFGIDTDENSFGYLASWAENKDVSELRASLETINATASNLISSIEKAVKSREKELEQTEQTAEQPIVPPQAIEKNAPPEPELQPFVLPDPTVDLQDAQEHGYSCDGMFLLSCDRAAELMEAGCEIYLLHDNGTETPAGAVDPSRDNMLKITSDGRKLGLDQRIVNPEFGDAPQSKVNQCVGNILQYYRDGQADRQTQLVFCDISTPKTKAALRAAAKAEQGNLNTAEGFNVYTDIRDKLIAGGVPPEEIAFIHDADTEAKKKELFSKVRAGKVRVLMGSTSKMGAGMNVQDRLIALHDLDAPWRPGDLEQRSGRIIRQGNRNKQVHIHRYVTEATFDAYLWQTLEQKQKFISQIMTSKSPVRSCDDVDETALSFAEIKALCAGDPRIKEKMDLDIEVSKLKVMKAGHQSRQFRLEDQILKEFPAEIEQCKGYIEGFRQDLQTLAAHPVPEEGFVGMVVRGNHLTDKENAGAALIDAMKDAKIFTASEIGTYRGMKMFISLEDFGKKHILTLKGQMSHRVELGKDPKGNLIRIENALNGIPERLKSAETRLETLENQMADAKAELGKPFEREVELQQKSARLAELNIALNMDGHGEETVIAEPDEKPKAERPSVLARLQAAKEKIAATAELQKTMKKQEQSL